MNRKIKIFIKKDLKASSYQKLQSVVEVGDSPESTAKDILQSEFGVFDKDNLSQQQIVQEGSSEVVVFEYIV